VMSIDPKLSETVLSEKQWTVLGKTSITRGGDDAQDVARALRVALNRRAGPAATPDGFAPRLAISVDLDLHGRTQKYVLLMSFDSRLAEVYVDHKCKGCCGISNVAGADQLINNVLASKHVPLKPKSAASSK
jgi:hypothetical protein